MWVLHRDLKPNNLLIAPDGTLKLADFGLARVFGSPDRTLTNQVFQRWYRAPELLYGARSYGPAVDMWALGCIFAELMLSRPYFAGTSDLDQLAKVFAALGTPTEEDWPGMRTLPDFVEYVSPLYMPASYTLGKASPKQMLCKKPTVRTTRQAPRSGRHPTMQTAPLP